MGPKMIDTLGGFATMDEQVGGNEKTILSK
jgi:hypothetical protein